MPCFRFPDDSDQSTWSGERFIVGRSGEIEFEHYHRYLLAAQFCTGLDVLDIASGEGYGAVVLSQVARQVTGVEIAPDVVAAAERAYASEKLRFCVGSCQSIPVADASVDVVVSFETVEHIVEHEMFMLEIKRVLRPGGVVVMSTPDRDIYSPPGSEPNPFHLRELDRPEFAHLLQSHFIHVAIATQKATAGSVIVPLMEQTWRFESFTRLNGRDFNAAATPEKAPYLVAIASDTALPEVRWGLLDDADFLNTIQRRVMAAEAKLNEEVGRLESDKVRLSDALAEHQAEVIRVNAAFAERQAEVVRVNVAFAERQAEVIRVNAAYSVEAKRVGTVRAALDREREEAARLSAEVVQKQDEVARLTATNDEWASASIWAEREKQAIQVEQDRLGRQLQSLIASSSWRVTRPIRVLKRALLEGSTGRRILREQLGRGDRSTNFAPTEPVPAQESSAPPLDLEAPQPQEIESVGLPEVQADTDPRPLVLFVTHDCSRTGAPVVCLRLLEELVRRQEYQVACVGIFGGVLAEEFAALAPLHILRHQGENVPLEQALGVVLGHFAETPAVAICSTVVSGSLVPALHHAGVPVLSLIHELPTTISYYGSHTINAILDHATDIVFGSAFVKDRVIGEFGEGNARISVIPTGYVDPAPPGTDRNVRRAQLRAAIGAPEDAIVIIGCGTVDFRKGTDLFVQIAASICRAQPEQAIRFVWIGDKHHQAYAAWLDHDVERLDLTGRFHFHGPANDVDALIGGADIFLLTSREDPYPLVNLAALGCGVPVVAFAGAGGAPEAIGSEAGIVVPYLDVAAMTNATLRLIDDQPLRVTLGTKGRDRFLHSHQMPAFADQIMTLLPMDARSGEP